MYYLNHLRNLHSHCMLVALCLLLQLSSSAQSLPSDAYVSMRASSTPGIVTGNYFIEVPDTADVSQIEIKLGTSMGATDFVNAVLDYDVTTGLPGGFSYLRTATIVKISIGDYAENAAYYGQVRLKNGGGSWSTTYNFVSN